MASASSVRPASMIQHHDAALRFDRIRLDRKRLAQALHGSVLVFARDI